MANQKKQIASAEVTKSQAKQNLTMAQQKICKTIKEEKDEDGITYVIRCEEPGHKSSKKVSYHSHHQKEQFVGDSEMENGNAMSMGDKKGMETRPFDSEEEVESPEEDGENDDSEKKQTKK